MKDPYPQAIYFIGIALPPDLNEAITKIKWDYYGENKHYLKPLLPHVTLLHPPSLKGIMPAELLPRVHEVAERYLPLTLSMEEIGFFDDNVCFIRVQSQSLYSLQSQLVRLLPPEAQALHYKRPYTPHITLAQAYEPKALDVQRLRTELPNRIALPQQFTVESVSFFKRILPRVYTPEDI